jgi:3-deoxy-D-manno-octulosonic-acid transferase
MFILYQILMYVFLPFALLRLLFKSKKHIGYRKNILERLAYYKFNTSLKKYASKPHNFKYIWVHGVSVGETKASQPLIEALLNKYPKHIILFTNTTPTGREAASKLFANFILQKRLQNIYLPFDIGLLVNSFYRYFKPMFGILLESEIWPNLLYAAKKHNVPLFLVNGRLSPKSYRRMHAYKKWSVSLFNTFKKIGAQSDIDYTQYTNLGLKHVELTGNIKFDCLPNMNLLHRGQQVKNVLSNLYASNSKPWILLASSREGEEAYILQAWLSQHKPCRLIILPRHLHRIAEIELLFQKYDLTYIYNKTILNDIEILNQDKNQSKNQNTEFNYDIILGDSMGEMSYYIELSDIVMMGGSWLPFGSHNLLEPCMQGKYVFLGPHTYNFNEISQKAIVMKAAIQFKKATQAFEYLKNMQISEQTYKNIKKDAYFFVSTYQGATLKTINMIEKSLDANKHV